MDLLDRLLEHDRWATIQLLELSRELTDAQLDQPFDIGHQNIRATFEHMFFNVEAWTAFMSGQPEPRRDTGLSLDTLIEQFERAHAALHVRAPQT